MVQLRGTGPVPDPRQIQPPPPPKPEQEKLDAKKLAEKAEELKAAIPKDDAGDILDNVSGGAKLAKLGLGSYKAFQTLRPNPGQAGEAVGRLSQLADNVAGKLDRGLSLVADQGKFVADQAKQLAGAAPKAAVGSAGTLERNGLTLKQGPDGKLRLTRGSKLKLKMTKAGRAVADAPGVRHVKDGAKAVGEAVANSGVAKAHRKLSENMGVKLNAKADALGKKAAQEGGEKLATKLAGKAAKVAATTALKGAGRFAPGANIAIAAADAYIAYKTLNDPNASAWKKGTKVATAALSAVSATNIPVVSQVAAGLSLVTDIASNVNPSKALEGAKNLGSKAVDLGKKIFGGL